MRRIPLRITEALHLVFRRIELALHHIEEYRYRSLPEFRFWYQSHLQDRSDQTGHKLLLVLPQVEPHSTYLKAHLTSHVPVTFYDSDSFVRRERFELESRLGHERYGTVEEVAPSLVVEALEEVVADCVREEAERFEYHVVLEHYHVAPVLRENGEAN